MHSNEEKASLIPLCSSLSMAAHKRPPFVLERTSSAIVFAFSASWDADNWLVNGASSAYGELEVDSCLFPSLKSVGNGVVAAVNGAFLRSFIDVLESSSSGFEVEVNKALSEKRKFVFTGHSSGGSVAVLAALWLLEKRLKLEHGDPIYPFCVTFGSPLVGDGVLVHAIQRENWSHCFLNFVMGVDIIPRCLLAPLSGFKEALQAILNFFSTTTLCFRENNVARSQVTFFYGSVLTNALSISNHQACLLMGCVNPLLEVMTGFVKVTPYRPIGTYVFCSSKGKLISLECSNAILQMLLCSFQIRPEEDVAEFAYSSLEEHLQYDPRIKECLDVQKIVSMNSFNLLSSFDGVDNEVSPIKKLLKDFDLSYGARLFLHAAGEWEKHKLRNQKKIDSNYTKIQEALDFLIDYRSSCEMRGVGYYDMFKLQKGTEDFNANVKRLELAGLWDEIVEMLRRYELPDSFEARIEWVKLGTRYRNLVEPLDIANYYRHSKNEDTGPYMVKGRPKRYRYTQRWLEHSEQMSTGSSNESCFWALVEELCSDTNNIKPFLDVKFKVLELEKELVRWINEGKLGRDVLLSESTFVKWWRTLPKQHRLDSCIASLVN